MPGPSLNGNGHATTNEMDTSLINTTPDWPGRWSHTDKILSRPSPFAPDFSPGDATKDFLRNKCKILVIGAGGLGCEILANLGLLGFKDVHVIDMDTIDISNLNRQFLFRHKDVGRPKAIAAAEFIMRRVPGCNVTPYFGKIQDKDDEYYMQFNLVICGLDSIEARRWINAKLVQLVDEDNPESMKPLIDGGTEGFKGQSKVILPTLTACIECQLDLNTPQTTYPLCTIQNTPRLPEHCISWASVLEWPRVFKDKKMDTDDPDHIGWLFERASKRAAEFKIEGVTWSLTQGVVKNIIPAIASTNAIIAASSCNEAFKIATTSAPYLDNYMQYSGTESPYTHTFQYEKKPDCPVCGGEVTEIMAPRDQTLEDFIEDLKARPTVQLKRPSFSLNGAPLYWVAPAQIEQSTRANLSKTLGELLTGTGSEDLTVTDSALPIELNLRITFA